MKHTLAVALLSLVTIPPAASIEPDRGQLKGLTVDDLKALYLACNDRALEGQLGSGGIAQCSVVYEELKQRAFEGDFERFLAWSRSQPDAARVGRAAREIRSQ
jgi:hypothetical protein